MNVLIDLRWMVIGSAGGMEQLAFELVASLDGLDSDDRFFVYCPRRTYREWDLNSPSRVSPIFSDEYGLIPEHPTFEARSGTAVRRSSKLGVISNVSGQSSDRYTIDIDLVHSIGGYISADLIDYRSVVTVLDLQHLHYPEFFSAEETQAREKNHREAIEISDRIICISEAVKKDVCRHYSVAAEKVDSIWVIPSSLYWADLPVAILARTLSTLGVSGDYLYFPSHAWAHKNHETLLRAMIEVQKSCPELSLILTGGHFNTEHPVYRLIHDLGLQDKVKHLGYRTPLEVRCLLQNAKMLVYPSLFEGFGLPVAEAIIVGVPVACSSIAPLIEIGREGIVTFDPRDSADMAAKIVELATDRSLRKKKRAHSQARRSLFSPNRIGRKTLNLYRSICGQDRMGKKKSSHRSGLKRERARHGLRRFDTLREESKWIEATGAWTGSFFNDPAFALTILKDLLSRRKRAAIPFADRYEDGWIGPRYLGWFLVPEDAECLEIRFEAPPEILHQKATFRASIGGSAASEYSFGDKAELIVTLALPQKRSEWVPLEVYSDLAFVPRDHGFSEDSRNLSMKLGHIRWISETR